MSLGTPSQACVAVVGDSYWLEYIREVVTKSVDLEASDV